MAAQVIKTAGRGALPRQTVALAEADDLDGSENLARPAKGASLIIVHVADGGGTAGRFTFEYSRNDGATWVALPMVDLAGDALANSRTSAGQDNVTFLANAPHGISNIRARTDTEWVDNSPAVSAILIGGRR